VRCVAREEHATLAVTVDEADVGAPQRGPRRRVEADVGAAGASLEDRLHVGQAELGILPRRDGRLILEDVGRGQRTQADQAFLVLPQVPCVGIEAVDLDVGDDHPHRVAGLTLEDDAGLRADDAVAAVAAHQPARGDGLGGAVLGDRR